MQIVFIAEKNTEDKENAGRLFPYFTFQFGHL